MDGNISKRHLKNIIMYVDHVEREYVRNWMTFTWNLPSFFKQRSFTTNTKKIDTIGFHFMVKQDRDSFSVIVDASKSGIVLDISCTVRSKGSYTSPSIQCPQVFANMYQMKFPPSDFKLLKNCALNHDGTIELRFEISISNTDSIYSKVYSRDYTEFFKLKTSVGKRFPPDFRMKSMNEGTEFHCPKSLLAARSKFFLNYFDDPKTNKNEMLINTSSVSLGASVVYLYCGSLYISGLQLVLDVIKLAWKLDIPSLKSNCSRIIRSFLNSTTVHQIRREGIKTGMTFLVELADNFLESMREKISQELANCRERYK